jgi:P-type E1-E2 ATPase
MTSPFDQYIEQDVAIEDLQKGDLLLVKPGEKIPLDGIIRSGTAHLDESMITGESLPISKTEGETVIGSTLLLDSPLIIETIATGSETYLSKIIAVVEQAQNSKPQIQYQVDKIMKVFIPVVLGIALVSSLLWLLIGLNRTSLAPAQVIRYAIQAFVGVLVIACPCGLGLATPMAIITGIGHAAKHGILAKNADGLVKLRKVKIVAFDKTGTITEGKPALVEMHSLTDKKDHKEELFHLQMLASLEATSTHPIANAILQYAKENTIEILPVHKAKNHAGKGIS